MQNSEETANKMLESIDNIIKSCTTGRGFLELPPKGSGKAPSKSILFKVFSVPYCHGIEDKSLEKQFFVGENYVHKIFDYISSEENITQRTLSKESLEQGHSLDKETIQRHIDSEEDFIPLWNSWGSFNVYSFELIDNL